ncbi:MAG: hypothetical protein OXG47_07785 [bacterium]|nr:hypothetical protein [bacterium]
MALARSEILRRSSTSAVCAIVLDLKLFVDAHNAGEGAPRHDLGD